MHFSEMIKLQFGNKRHKLLCILLLFRMYVKMRKKIKCNLFNVNNTGSACAISQA